jgi:hypothetical protein
MVRKGGRPSKTARLEREQRKAAAAKLDQERERAGEPNSSPLTQFAWERLISQLPRDHPWRVGWRLRGTVPESALWETLRSDLDLPPSMRRWVADMLQKTSKQQRAAEARSFLRWVNTAKEYLFARGWTMQEAEQEIAKARGWTIKTLHTKLTRARKRVK